MKMQLLASVALILAAVATACGTKENAADSASSVKSVGDVCYSSNDCDVGQSCQRMVVINGVYKGLCEFGGTNPNPLNPAPSPRFNGTLGAYCKASTDCNSGLWCSIPAPLPGQTWRSAGSCSY